MVVCQDCLAPLACLEKRAEWAFLESEETKEPPGFLEPLEGADWMDCLGKREKADSPALQDRTDFPVEKETLERPDSQASRERLVSLVPMVYLESPGQKAIRDCLDSPDNLGKMDILGPREMPASLGALDCLVLPQRATGENLDTPGSLEKTDCRDCLGSKVTVVFLGFLELRDSRETPGLPVCLDRREMLDWTVSLDAKVRMDVQGTRETQDSQAFLERRETLASLELTVGPGLQALMDLKGTKDKEVSRE